MGWDRTHSAEKRDIWDALDVQIGAIGSQRDTSAATYHVILRQGYEEDPPVVQTRSLEVYSRSGCEQHLVDKVVTLLRDLLTPPIQSTELRVAQYAPRYRVAFSLLNEDASYGGAVNGWLIEQAIEDYLQPTMDELGVLHNFTLESQVQFYAPLTTEPAAVQDGYALNQDQLKIFVNSAEWTLSSSVSNDPVLHFVLFVPSLGRRPLYIQDAHGKFISPIQSLKPLLGVISQFNSFLVPQWGGIAILNPSAHGIANKILTPQDLKPIFHLFKKQLEGLLGIPALPTAVAADLDPSTRRILTDWQLDTLLRRRTLENIRGSVQALTSIVGLVGQIENMPVGQTVRSDVLSALDELAQAHNTSQPVWTLTHSARSLLLASKAFFNPDMMRYPSTIVFQVLLEKKTWCLAIMTKSAGAQPVCTGLFDFGDANAYMHLAVTANKLTAEDMQNDRIAQIVSSARLRKEVPVELACNLSEKNPLVMLRKDASLTTLLEIFSRGTHRVLVEGQEQQVKGIITDSALVKFFASTHDTITASPVITQVLASSLIDLGVITPPPIVSASPDSTVLDAMTLMSQEGVSSIAVFDPDVGVLMSAVTVTDIGQLVIPSESKSVLAMKLAAFVSEIKNPHGMADGEDRYP
ncbi:GPI transamidase component, partial [Ceratobasidium sp. 395]